MVEVKLERTGSGAVSLKVMELRRDRPTFFCMLERSLAFLLSLVTNYNKLIPDASNGTNLLKILSIYSAVI